jgi:hypothetical protein
MENKFYEICLDACLLQSICEFLLMCHFQHSFNAECHDSEGRRWSEDSFNTANVAGEERLICKVNTSACEGTRVPETCYAWRRVC